MKKKFDFRRVTALLLCLLLCGVTLPQNASAAKLEEVDTVSLELTYVDGSQPITDVEFRIYRVGDIRGTNKYGLVAPFNSYNVTTDGVRTKDLWLELATTLAGKIAQDSTVTPTATGKTGEDGKVLFTVQDGEESAPLALGLYLIEGDTKTQGNRIYTPTTFLLALPNVVVDDNTHEYSWEANVKSAVKFRSNPTGDNDRDPDPVRRHVLKVWDDNGNEENRPESVTVDLLRNNRVYDTVTLSAANNWRHDWTNLDANANWQIAEHSVEGYTVAVSQNGITFVITNTFRNPPPPPEETPPPGETPPPEEDIVEGPPPLGAPPEEGPPEEEEVPDNDVPLSNLPQTGQLWWPVPVLAMGGILLIFLGFMQRRRWSVEDEE